jgi:hypothetical protein
MSLLKSNYKTNPKASFTMAMLLTLSLASTGCSTISDGMNAVGTGLVGVAESSQRFLSDVDINKEADDQFRLVQHFDEPVRELDSYAMRVEAMDACPEGYVYLNRSAKSMKAFGEHDASCASGGCGFELEWVIQCQVVPEEPFSFFGKI